MATKSKRTAVSSTEPLEDDIQTTTTSEPEEVVANNKEQPVEPQDKPVKEEEVETPQTPPTENAEKYKRAKIMRMPQFMPYSFLLKLLLSTTGEYTIAEIESLLANELKREVI